MKLPRLTPTFLYFLLYCTLRSISFIFPPDTALHGASIINTILSGAVVAATVYLLVKKNIYGWYAVAGEIILGGAGNFFALAGISLRTALLITSLTIFFAQNIRQIPEMYQKNKALAWSLGALYCAVGLGALHGYLAGHEVGLIFADTIPYLFFLYIFPLQKILGSDQARGFKQFALRSLVAAIIGNTLFIFLTLAAFSTGQSALQDTYYHWFRDVAGGKITELPFHFYRIVLNEQLVLIPLLLYFMNEIIKNEKNKRIAIILSTCLLSILAINLTRSFLLALAIGSLLLLRKKYWKRWFATGVLTGIAFTALFIGIHTVASRGQSLGLEIFGLRLQSIAAPSLEASSLSRLLLLPKIMEVIELHPVLGNGLASSVTVYSPVVKHEITTTQFDWGYLEIFAELGIIGLLSWGFVLGYILIKIKADSFEPAWELASLGALLVITLTSPALFHVLGIIWLTLLTLRTTSLRGDASQKSFS